MASSPTAPHRRHPVARKATRGFFALLLEAVEFPAMVALFVISCLSLLLFGASLIDLVWTGSIARIIPGYGVIDARANVVPGGLLVASLATFIIAHMARRALELLVDYVSRRDVIPARL